MEYFGHYDKILYPKNIIIVQILKIALPFFYKTLDKVLTKIYNNFMRKRSYNDFV